MTGVLNSQWDPRTVQASLIPAAAQSVGGVLSWFSVSRPPAGEAAVRDQVREPNPRGSGPEGPRGGRGGHRDALEDAAPGFALANRPVMG